jgi:Alginate lyase
MALAWYITRAQEYADKAISYMNAWARIVKAHELSNAPLQAGWSGSVWPRAAEIIRHTEAGWSESDINIFENTLRSVYLPVVLKGSQSNGNWELG